jgi:hypothetical protein
VKRIKTFGASGQTDPEAYGCIPAKLEKRTQVRTKMSLSGRYMLEDGSEFPCETVDVSPSGVLLTVAMVVTPGSRVVAHIERLGRIEGLVVRTVAGGFALALSCTPSKIDRLAARIEWLARYENGATEERRDGLRLDRDGAHVYLLTADQSRHPIELVDVSASGVSFLTDLPLEVGDRVELGAQKAKVARVFPGGAAAAFL